MKTAISLPDAVFNAAERLSRRKHMSRSELYATALQWYIRKEEKTDITEQLNTVYNHHLGDHAVIDSPSIADLPANDWK